ncbi:hypothetical protein Acor_40840 [Acrocarpospora corrugata]|uniref:Uncharacterized protein n=1 Tax=Acrocarpospora corrugata TaxID=35763 RepID=A0A5M3W149_9ACTN|nr:hypothetical protein Acor_40840 [Acrocarpospora corrugata]
MVADSCGSLAEYLFYDVLLARYRRDPRSLLPAAAATPGHCQVVTAHPIAARIDLLGSGLLNPLSLSGLHQKQASCLSCLNLAALVYPLTASWNDLLDAASTPPVA